MGDHRRCGLHSFDDEKYFDITHSFQVASSTYHILGLRKDRPTYGNTYYIFNCSSFHEPVKSPVFPPIVAKRKSSSGHKPADDLVSRKHVEKDQIKIEVSLNEIIKNQNEYLIQSIREEIHSDGRKMEEFFEKEKDLLKQILSRQDQHKKEFSRLFEEQQKCFQDFYEKYFKEIDLSIDRLKKEIQQFIKIENNTIQTNIRSTIQEDFTHIFSQQTNNFHSNVVQIEQLTNVETKMVHSLQQTSIQLIESHKQFHLQQQQYLQQKFIDHEKSFQNLFIKQQETFVAEFHSVKQSLSNLVQIIPQLFQQQLKSFTEVIQTLIASSKPTPDLAGKSNLTAISTNEIVSREFIRQSIFQAFEEYSSKTTRPIDGSGEYTIPYYRPFKLSIQSSEYADVTAQLKIDDRSYSNNEYTKCYRDPTFKDVVTVDVDPPETALNEKLELTLLAKTRNDSKYRARIILQLT